MAISYVSGGSGSTTTTTTSTTATVTYSSSASHFLGLLIGINNITSTVTSVVDNNTVSWNHANSIRTGSNGAELWYLNNAAAITSLTITMSAAARFSGIVQEYAGVGSVGQNNTASTTATTSSVAITLATGNNWIVGGFVLGGGRTLTSNTGTIRTPSNVLSGTNSGTFCISDWVDNTSASAISTAITINNGGNFNFSGCALELIPSGGTAIYDAPMMMGM